MCQELMGYSFTLYFNIFEIWPELFFFFVFFYVIPTESETSQGENITLVAGGNKRERLRDSHMKTKKQQISGLISADRIQFSYYQLVIAKGSTCHSEGAHPHGVL